MDQQRTARLIELLEDEDEAVFQQAIQLLSSIRLPDLSGRRLPPRVYEGLCLDAADLTAARISWATFHGCRFRGALLDGVVGIEASFVRCVLTGAGLRRADLRGARLSGCRMAEADLRGAVLEDAACAGVRLRGADLSGATLTHARLHGADLTEAVLYRADLSGSRLCGAALTGAVLYRARLCGADLTGADLRGARLQGADLTGAVLTGARQSAQTVWPD